MPRSIVLLLNIYHDIYRVKSYFRYLNSYLNKKYNYLFVADYIARDGRRPARSSPKIPAVGIAPNGRVFMTLRAPTGANSRHRARVCGRAQCGGAARSSAAEPKVLVRLDGHKGGPSTDA